MRLISTAEEQASRNIVQRWGGVRRRPAPGAVL